MIGTESSIWLGAAAIVLLAAALLSIWLGGRHSIKAKVIWTVIAVVIPIVGPLAWLALGRERRP